MKKIIGLLLLAVAFASADGTSVVEGWRYATFEVGSHEWQLSDDGTYFWCTKPWDEITDYVYEEGIVFGQMYTWVGEETLTPLPYALDCKDGNLTWQEHYTFDYSPGTVAFYVSYDDFQMDVPPGTQTFRVTILW